MPDSFKAVYYDKETNTFKAASEVERVGLIDMRRCYAEFIVDQDNGSDAAPFDKPVKTIQEACNRALKVYATAEDIRILLKGGVHEISSTITMKVPKGLEYIPTTITIMPWRGKGAPTTRPVIQAEDKHMIKLTGIQAVMQDFTLSQEGSRYPSGAGVEIVASQLRRKVVTIRNMTFTDLPYAVRAEGRNTVVEFRGGNDFLCPTSKVAPRIAAFNAIVNLIGAIRYDYSETPNEMATAEISYSTFNVLRGGFCQPDARKGPRIDLRSDAKLLAGPKGIKAIPGTSDGEVEDGSVIYDGKLVLT